MGACVSVQKNPDSAMKIRLSFGGSKPDKAVIIPSPIDDNSGSKEETFFDSQAWMESDCEDDFLSVNGDLTPSSSGSTPLHHSLPTGALLKNATPNSKLEQSPTDKKKKLADLFGESLGSNGDFGDGNISSNNRNAANGEAEEEEGKKTSLDLLASRSVNGVVRRPEEEKPSRSAQCCLPSLMPSRSFSERKKKMNHTRSIG